MGKKSKKKAKKLSKKIEKRNAATETEKNLKAEIIRRVGMEVELRDTGSGIYEASRTVKPTIQNRWAERIQRIHGVKIIGTEDLVTEKEMKQTVTFRYVRPSNDLTVRPSKPVVILRRASESEVIRREANWYTRATVGSKPFVPFYLRENRPLFEPIG